MPSRASLCLKYPPHPLSVYEGREKPTRRTGAERRDGVAASSWERAASRDAPQTVALGPVLLRRVSFERRHSVRRVRQIISPYLTWPLRYSALFAYFSPLSACGHVLWRLGCPLPLSLGSVGGGVPTKWLLAWRPHCDRSVS